MKVAVKVRLKKSILDPQGTAILHALQSQGVKDIHTIRMGKLIELEMDDHANPDKVKEMMEDIAKRILANVVMEDFEIEYGENP